MALLTCWAGNLKIEKKKKRKKGLLASENGFTNLLHRTVLRAEIIASKCLVVFIESKLTVLLLNWPGKYALPGIPAGRK